VKSVDLNRWVTQNILPDDYAVLKMDIEAAEYFILPAMQFTGTISRFKEVIVEYHERADAIRFSPIHRSIHEWWAQHPEIVHKHWR